MGALHDQNQWQARRQSDAQVQTATVFAGSKAVAMATNALVWRGFSDASATNVWIDFYARVPYPTNDTAPALTGSVTAAFFVTDAGKIRAISNETWVTLDHTVTNDAWTRFTVHLDYGASSWDLYVADNVPNRLATMVATNLAFSSASTNQYFKAFRVRN